VNRFALLTALPFLAAAACSSPAGEDTQSSQEPLGIQLHVLSNVHVTADHASVTITYTRAILAPYTLTLTGPAGTTSLAETSVNGATGVVFAGLEICTAYTFAIVDPSGVALESGSIHTLQTGDVVCPTTETVPPTRSYQFEGAYHWRNDAAWCYPSDYSQAWGVYPLFWPWWDVRLGGATVGYQHYWDAGAQPFPCQERGVDVYRAMFEWDLGASRKRRVHAATVQATVTSPQICVNQWQQMGLGSWSYSSGNLDATNDYGATWPEVFPPGIGTGRGMSIVPNSAGRSLTVNGNTLTTDVTSSVASIGYVGGGFAVPNDGFADPTGSEPPYTDYPQDDNVCMTGLANVGVTLEYDAITPDTPMNCSATLDCDQFTVTCDGAPDTFEVHQNVDGADTIVGTAQGSTTGPVTISGTQNEDGAPLSVCTASHGYTGVYDKLTNCTGTIPVTSSKACPVKCPACPSGYVCQVTDGQALCVVNHRCMVGTHYCHGACIPQASPCL
jgi:hypothetical protein